MTSDFIWAMVIAALISILLCLIEIPWLSKSNRPQANYFTMAFVIYLAIVFVGNEVTTIVANAVSRQIFAPAIPPTEPSNDPGKPDVGGALRDANLPLSVRGFLAAFLGCFAFKAFLEKINITFAGSGVLTIETWISKARDTAVTVASAKTSDLDLAEKTILANRINQSAKLTEPDLNAYIDTWMGNGKAKSLDAIAQQNGVTPRLYKALAVASVEYAKASTMPL